MITSFSFSNFRLIFDSAGKIEDYHKLQNLSSSHVLPAFEEDFTDFKNMLMKSPKVKSMFGKNLSGKNFADLAFELSISKIPVLKYVYVNTFQYEIKESITDSAL